MDTAATYIVRLTIQANVDSRFALFQYADGNLRMTQRGLDEHCFVLDPARYISIIAERLFPFFPIRPDRGRYRRHVQFRDHKFAHTFCFGYALSLLATASGMHTNKNTPDTVFISAPPVFGRYNELTVSPSRCTGSLRAPVGILRRVFPFIAVSNFDSARKFQTSGRRR